MSEQSHLSDKAAAVFAFAAYHQLGSGQPVTKVVREDGSGHKADDDAVAELTRSGLIALQGNDIGFTETGLAMLSGAVDALRGAIRQAASPA